MVLPIDAGGVFVGYFGDAVYGVGARLGLMLDETGRVLVGTAVNGDG